MYYKPTRLFSSKFLYRYRTLIYGIFVYIRQVHIVSPPLFRADEREIAHGLIVRTIRYYMNGISTLSHLSLSLGYSGLLKPMWGIISITWNPGWPCISHKAGH